MMRPTCSNCGGAMTVRRSWTDICHACGVSRKAAAERAGRHYVRSRVTTYTGIASRRVAALKREGMARSRRLGHDVPTMEPDAVPEGWIGECRSCGGFIVVDRAEAPTAYGNAVTRPCPGTRYGPAPRRLLTEYAVPTACARLEPADTDAEV